MRARTWRWLRGRIQGLFTLPPRLTDSGAQIPVTRIGLALMPEPKAQPP